MRNLQVGVYSNQDFSPVVAAITTGVRALRYSAFSRNANPFKKEEQEKFDIVFVDSPSIGGALLVKEVYSESVPVFSVEKVSENLYRIFNEKNQPPAVDVESLQEEQPKASVGKAKKEPVAPVISIPEFTLAQIAEGSVLTSFLS